MQELNSETQYRKVGVVKNPQNFLCNNSISSEENVYSIFFVASLKSMKIKEL